MYMNRRLGLVAAVLAFSIMAVAARNAEAATVKISILAEEFDPEIISVKVGDTVTWTNEDSTPHMVTSDQGDFMSPLLDKGEKYSYTFKTSGQFEFYDHMNVEMGGFIVVDVEPTDFTPSPKPGPAPTPPPSPNPVPTPPTSQPYLDGSLILDNGTIYLIEYGKKRPFASMNVFNGWGYKMSNVMQASTANVPAGDGLFTADQRHVRGSIVVHNGTVYFLGANTRYAFPSADVFLSWSLKFSDVVPANSYDVAIPEGALMYRKP
jgi:plastocyanin